MAGQNISGAFKYGVTGTISTGTVTVSASGATVLHQRDITIAMVDTTGATPTTAQVVRLALFNDAAGAAFLTNNPGAGLLINGTGDLAVESLISGQTTKGKTFTAITSATGTLALKWFDGLNVAAFLGIVNPDGTVVFSTALTTT